MGQITTHFKTSEFICRCGCGRMEIPFDFIYKLELLRLAFNRPMVITSGYRCPTHNRRVSRSGDNGPHTIAAADVAVSGRLAHRLLQHAFIVGFTGIGVAQKGAHGSRFIHLDDLPAHNHPRPWVWSY